MSEARTTYSSECKRSRTKRTQQRSIKLFEFRRDEESHPPYVRGRKKDLC